MRVTLWLIQNTLFIEKINPFSHSRKSFVWKLRFESLMIILNFSTRAEESFHFLIHCLPVKSIFNPSLQYVESFFYYPSMNWLISQQHITFMHPTKLHGHIYWYTHTFSDAHTQLCLQLDINEYIHIFVVLQLCSAGHVLHTIICYSRWHKMSPL